MKSFVVASKIFFGQKPNQTLSEFAEELNQLTEKDSDELTPLLAKELGEEVSPRDRKVKSGS